MSLANNILLWAVGFYLLGGLLFVGFPILVGPMLPREFRQRLGRAYGHMAMFSLDRALLVRRKHGGYALAASSFHGGKRSEEISMNKETEDYEDTATCMQLLYNKKFGITYGKSNIITTPKLSALAKAAKEFAREEKHKLVDADGRKYFSASIGIDATHRMVDIANSIASAPGSADPKLADDTEHYTKLSQIGFKSANWQDTMTLLLAFGLGVLAVMGIFPARANLGGGGGGTSISLMVSTLGVFV
jgi:hypothetical protein